MINVKYDNIYLNGAHVVRINGREGNRRAISEGVVDFNLVEPINAWREDTIVMVRNHITAKGFKPDSIKIKDARLGQYNIGVEYDFNAELDISQHLIEEIVKH